MASSLPIEKPVTKKDLLRSPEEWLIAHVGLYSVTYHNDQRGWWLMLPLESEEEHPDVQALERTADKG